MKSIIKIDYENRVIHYNKTFETKASNPNSKEHEQLVRCCQQFPSFRIERRTIKKNLSKETYEGIWRTQTYFRVSFQEQEIPYNQKVVSWKVSGSCKVWSKNRSDCGKCWRWFPLRHCILWSGKLIMNVKIEYG